MAEKEKQQTVETSVAKEREGQSPTLSREEMYDALERYDGFMELLGPLAENLDRFKPGARRKTRKFLQDNDLVDDRKALLERLEAYVQYLGNSEVQDHKSVRVAGQEKLDTHEELINDNLERILEEARDIERTYREIELFFQNAAPQKAKNITLLNVHPEVLLDPDANLVYNTIEQLIMNEARSVDQRKAYAALVIPNLWRSKRPKDLIERYTKLAGAGRISFLTDFSDVESVEEALKERELPKWQGFTGPEAHHSKLIVFANHLVLRGEHRDLGEEEALHGSPALAVAGKMYAERISQPIMGEMNGSITGSRGLAFRTVADEVADLSEVGLNAMMHAFEKDMVYECASGFTGAEYPLKRYAIVRTFDYVNRVLRHYLGKVTGQQLDRNRANKVRDTIQDFLDQLVEQKIITSGKVSQFEWNRRVPDRIDVQVDIIPLWAVRTFVYALKAKRDQNTESDLKEIK